MRSFIFLLLIIALIAPLVSGQEATPDDDDDDVIVLDPFEVTSAGDRGYTTDRVISSTRFAVDADEVARSINVLNEKFLNDFAVTDLDDAEVYFAGVTHGGTDGIYNIRGFTTQSPYRDGIRQTEFSEGANVARVEVLKGPASILYGQMQPGGVVNRISKRPLAGAQTELQLHVGEHDFLRLQVDTTGPLHGEELLHRFIFAYQTNEDQQDFYQQERVLVNPMVTWHAASWMRVDFNTEFFWRDETGGRDWQPLIRTRGEDGRFQLDIPDLPRSFSSQFDADSLDQAWTHTLDVRLFLPRDITWMHTFRYVDRDLWGYTWDVVSEWREPLRRSPARPILEETFWASRRLRTKDHRSETFIYQTNAIWEYFGNGWDNKLLVGFDFAHVKDLNAGADGATYAPTDANFGAVPVLDLNGNYLYPAWDDLTYLERSEIDALITLDTDATRYDYAVYIMEHARLFDERLILSASARYDWYDRTTINVRFTPDNPDREVEFEDDHFSPNLGVVYKLTPQISAFAAYATSVQANDQDGGGRVITNPEGEERFVPWDPLLGKSSEIGMRFDLLDQRVQATATLFDTRVENLLRTDPESQQREESGEEATQGLELEIVAALTQNWQVRLNYAWMDGFVSEDPNPELQDLERALVPEHSWTLFSTWRLDKGPLEGVEVSAAWIRQDESATWGIGASPNTPIIAANPPFVRPAFDRVDVNFIYNLQARFNVDARIALRIENLFDERYIREGRRLAWGRTFQASLTWRL